MQSGLDAALGISSPTLGLEAQADHLSRAHKSLYEVSFLTAWEIQSQVAAVVLIALVALASVWATLGVMIAWSLVATCLYYYGRKRGLPDVLDTQWSIPRAKAGQWREWLRETTFSLLKAWLAGLQPFLYSLTFCRILPRPVNCWRLRVARMAVLAIGLTLFGVTAAHHMLHKAGLPDDKVLKLSFLGPFLNVPYRILLSAIIFNAALQLARPFTS